MLLMFEAPQAKVLRLTGAAPNLTLTAFSQMSYYSVIPYFEVKI